MLKTTETSPMFSIIIPTKNRAKYLFHTLRTCTAQTYDNLEIIISDDGSTDNTREIVEDAKRTDSRIRLFVHDPSIGMRDNFEFALNQVKPGFVIALGGDDGLLPNGILGMREILKTTNAKLLSWPAALYSFPGVYGPNGQIVIHHRKGVKIANSQNYLNRQAKNLYYLTDVESPMFYVKGVVSTDLIDQVRRRSPEGRFYSCSTPDGYSGIVLAGETPFYAFSGEPFSIYGMSSSSQGLAYLSNDEKAKIDSENFFRDAALKPMHTELASQPYSPLITLMTVDFLLTARDLPGWAGTVPSINFKTVLEQGIRELALGMYGERRICRELNILKKIADFHGLGNYFLTKLANSRRNQEIGLFDGNGISPSVFYIDAKPYGIDNIFDAAYTAKSIYNTYASISPKSLFNTIIRSLSYKFRATRKGGPFPPQSEWENLF